MSDNAWVTRGWVGDASLIGPFKAALEAAWGVELLNVVAPARGLPPDLMSQPPATIVGFAIEVRPHVPIEPPAGAIAMAPHIAAALINPLSAAPAAPPA